MKLLVEQIKVDRNEDGHAQVQITYRFGPPPEEPENVYGVQNSVLWYNARRQWQRAAKETPRLWLPSTL